MLVTNPVLSLKVVFMAQSDLERPHIKQLYLRRFLALAGMGGPVMLIAADLTAAFSQPGYNWLRDSISSLAWTPMGWLQTIGFLAMGLLTELFVAGIFFNIRGTKGFSIGIGLLVLFGFGLLLIGAFHTDYTGVPATVTGMIHGGAARSIFFLFMFSSGLIAPSLKNDPAWRRLFLYSLVASILTLVLIIVGLWVTDGNFHFGLYERILVANTIIWVEVMSIWFLRLSFKRIE
jgi:hypothetical protein